MKMRKECILLLFSMYLQCAEKYAKSRQKPTGILVNETNVTK